MNNKVIPIIRQRGLLNFNRPSFYYRLASVNAFNLHPMELIDKQYTKDPAYGDLAYKTRLYGQ